MEVAIDSYIAYSIRAPTEVFFDIPEHKKVNATLIDGRAQIVTEQSSVMLTLEHRREMFENFSLHSKSDCTILIRGNHSISGAHILINQRRKNLFTVAYRNNSYTFTIDRETQLHISVCRDNSSVKLTLISGNAEVFGCPLILNKTYELPPESSYLVNSFVRGTFTVQIEGKNRRITISALRDQTFQLMRKAHETVENMRSKAQKNDCIGPVVLVLGPSNVGKTSFCHFLINKAVQKGWKPLYLDLDVRRNSNTLPGAISLVIVDGEDDVTTGFISRKKKVLYFGSTDPSKNLYFYFRLILRMSVLLDNLTTQESTPLHSGLIIDICSSIEDDSENVYRILKHFNVDYIVVIGDDDYYNCLNGCVSDLPKSYLIRLPKIFEKRCEKQEKRIQNYSIRKYFYGTSKNPLDSHHFQIKFSDVQIYTALFNSSNEARGEESAAKVQFRKVTSMNEIVHHVLGVSQATTLKPFRLLTEIKCFVWVSDVNVQKETITLLTRDGKFSKAILLMGDITMEKRSPRI